MAHIWATSKQKGTALLLLLAIADFANDDGEAWPAVETLAKKIRMTERYTHMLLRQLTTAGELAIDMNAGKHGCNLFTVGGVKPASPVKPSSVGGEARFPKGVRPASPEPSVNHQETPAANRTVEIQSEYEALVGRKLDRSEWTKQEGAAAKRIGAQYTTAQLRRAYGHYKAQPFWSDKRLTLNYLSKNMGEMLAGSNGHQEHGPMLPEGLLDG